MKSFDTHELVLRAQLRGEPVSVARPCLLPCATKIQDLNFRVRSNAPCSPPYISLKWSSLNGDWAAPPLEEKGAFDEGLDEEWAQGIVET